MMKKKLTAERSLKAERSARRSNYISAIHQQDPDLAQVVLLLKNSPEKWTSISNHSGVSRPTLKNWMKGRTRRPFNVTITFVMSAMGYSRRWEKK